MKVVFDLLSHHEMVLMCLSWIQWSLSTSSYHIRHVPRLTIQLTLIFEPIIEEKISVEMHLGHIAHSWWYWNVVFPNQRQSFISSPCSLQWIWFTLKSFYTDYFWNQLWYEVRSIIWYAAWQIIIYCFWACLNIKHHCLVQISLYWFGIHDGRIIWIPYFRAFMFYAWSRFMPWFEQIQVELLIHILHR